MNLVNSSNLNKQKMKIIQIVPGLALGGPTFSVTTLTRHLMKLGQQVQLYAHDKDVNGFEEFDIHPFHILKFPYNKQLAYSLSLKQEIIKESKDADIIQTNSLWQYPNFVMNNVPKSSAAKIVIVPRGTLSDYALSISSIKKKIVLAIGQQKSLNNADMFIATCDKEYHDIRRFGLKQPVAIIPNGLELPELHETEKTRTVLFLARLHKVKGLDILLDVWKEITNEGAFSDWNLTIAGPTTSDYAKQMISKSSNMDRVSFIGEVYGDEKRNVMSEAAIYVLPTHTENFGISIAEALAHGTPVITTTGAPWSGLEENNCGKWIDLSHDNLKQTLVDMMQKTLEELSIMGQNGREWISRDYSWPEIAEKTIKSYEWLLNPTKMEKPNWIRLD